MGSVMRTMSKLSLTFEGVKGLFEELGNSAHGEEVTERMAR